LTFEGLVYRRTDVKGSIFDDKTGKTVYHFTALVFGEDGIGLKFNVPGRFSTEVVLGHRVRIESPMTRKDDFVMLNEYDVVTDVGPSDVDPVREYTFFGGYISLAVNGKVSIHDPEGLGGVEIVRIPEDQVDRVVDACSYFTVKGIRVTRSLIVSEVVGIVPRTMTRTWEEKVSRLWFSDEGFSIRRINGQIFIPSDILPFECDSVMNSIKMKLHGSVRIEVEYRLTARWVVQREMEDRRWVPVRPISVTFSDPSVGIQLSRMVAESSK
jgi:hypothetical protein